ncbi:MAG: FkbM family methyltransferase [Symploca sp. SIO2B6]|nr:FkbM family methyltransferase [Symploca sp. SIO2B6]
MIQVNQHQSKTLMEPVKNISGLVSVRGHHFYANLINSNSVVVDLGSHLGQFSHQVSNLFKCQCYAVEALPSLHQKIVQNPLVKKFNYAISSADKPVEFCVTDNPEANHVSQFSVGTVSEKITVEGVTIESFMDRNNIECIDLLKVDIEGAEIDLFNSMSDKTLKSIKQITVEFHDFKFQISREVEAIKAKLKSLGFACIVFSMTTNGDVLFINLNKSYIPKFRYIYIRYFAKYVRAFPRLMKRLFSKLILN